MKTAAAVMLCVIMSILGGCTAVTAFRFVCEGKCSGELSRDIDASSPEQLKRTPK